MKILVNDGMSKSGADALRAAGFTLYEDKVPQDQLAEFMSENQVDAILVRSATQVRKDLMDAVPSLKLIGRGGVGLDNIDVDYASQKGIYVINTPAASSESVAELVFAHLFSLVRGLHDSNRNMPLEGETKFNALKKSYEKSIELKGKTIGVIGLGRIGKEVARMALGLGMRVIGTDHSDTDGLRTINVKFFNGESLAFKVEVMSMLDVFEQADFISFHIPAQKDGYVVGKEEIEKMKNGVMIVNAARGGIIDEVALLDALDSGKIAAAALDVFENEPKPEMKILMHPKLSLSPHIGGSTLEAQERIGTELAEQIISLLQP